MAIRPPTQFAENSYGSAAAITPSNSTVLSPPPTALWIGTSGTLVAVMAGNGGTVTVSVAASPPVTPLCVSQVLAATTATGIIGLW